MNKLKILLVDDELDFLEIMSLQIEKWGYEVIRAASGKEVLSLAKSVKPDIVVLDFMLPDMDGVGVLKEIRKSNKQIPVIMFTAYPNAEAMKDTEKLGVSAFIPKLSTYTDVQSSLKSTIEMLSKKLERKGEPYGKQ